MRAAWGHCGLVGLRDVVFALSDLTISRIRPLIVRRGVGVLVIRLDRLGDFLLWLPCAERMAAALGPENITLLTTPGLAALAEDLPFFGRVEVASPQALRKVGLSRISTLWRLAGTAYDLVLNPSRNIEHAVAESVVRVVPATNKVGWKGSAHGLRAFIRDQAYSVLLTTDSPWEGRRNETLLSHLGLPVPTLETVAKVGTALRRLSKGGETVLPGCLAILPGAGDPERVWPSDRFAELARRAVVEWSAQVVVLGTADDRVAAKAITAACAGRAVDLTGKTSVSEMIAWLDAARLVVSNESGGAHLAALLGVPSVAVTGGGHFGWFLPYDDADLFAAPSVANVSMDCFGCGWRCSMPNVKPGTPFECIKRVTVDAAWQIAQRRWLGSRVSEHADSPSRRQEK